MSKDINNPYFFLEGGKCGAMLQGLDWENNSMGLPENWSELTKSCVKQMLDMPIATCLYWGEDFIHLFNDAYLKILKQATDIGTPAHKSTHWEDLQPILREVTKGKTITYNDEDYLLLGDFQYNSLKISYTPIYASNRSVVGVQSHVVPSADHYTSNRTSRSIEQEAHVAKKLNESELKFRSLIEEAPIATALYIGRELRIDVANDTMMSYWGKGKDVIGKTIKELLPELEGQPFLQVLDNVFTTGKIAEFKETRVDLTVDGQLDSFYFDFTYKALRDINGEIYGILNTAIEVTEQVLAKRQLEKSQEQLLAYFEQSPVAIAIIAKENLTFKLVNPFYAQLVGRLPENLENKPLLEALPEIKGQGFDLILKNVIETKTAYIANEVDVKLQRNGQTETVYVNLTYKPQMNLKGEVTGILVVATDVTQQVVSRKAVENSEAKLRSVITNVAFGISVFKGEDFVIETANNAFIDMVGKDHSIIGKPFAKAVPELLGESQPFLDFLKYVYRSKKEFKASAILSRTTHNGVIREKYLDVIYTPIYDSDNKIYAILGITTDVTEQKINLEKIANAEASLRSAIEVAGLATWSLDIHKKQFTYSSRYMEWLGLTEPVVSEEEAYQLISDVNDVSVHKAIKEAVSNQSSGIYDVIHGIVNRATGQQRIIHANAALFYDQKGNALELRGTAQDITLQQQLQLALAHEVEVRTEELAAAVEELQSNNEEIEEANANLNRSNRELSQYAHIASHDLQEPLRKIRVFSNLLFKQESLSPENRAYVEKIETSAARMSLLIKDLLEFSELKYSEKIQRPVSLVDIVSDVITDFELSIAEKNVKISIKELPTIEAVKLQMNQLFYNLIGNALKFISPERTPEITIDSMVLPEEEVKMYIRSPKAHVPYYKISVKDNGIGFDVAYSEHIFEVFKRLHRHQVYPGSGIGLALCRQIVTNHAGHLFAESTLNAGATFHIILPQKS